MQEINYYNKPAPHIIIDEFLPPKLAKECLKECSELETFYEPAKIAGVGHQKDDCEECKKIQDYNEKSIRQNDVVYLDNLYKNKRKHSVILSALHDKMLDESFQTLFKNKGFFHNMGLVNSSESILSRYGMCDFYGYHVDQIPQIAPNRLITLCYYLNHEPEKFEGGELILTGDSIADTLKIIPKHNRAVIFQSDTTFHAVNTVKLLGDEFKDGRFSINFWLGINCEKMVRFR